MVRGNEVLQRDGDRLVEAAGFGGAEHDWLACSLSVASATQREIHRSGTMRGARLRAIGTVGLVGRRRASTEEELLWMPLASLP